MSRDAQVAVTQRDQREEAGVAVRCIAPSGGKRYDLVGQAVGGAVVGLLLDAFEQQLGLRDIGGLPRRERQRDGVAERIDDRMDFRRQAAARAPDGLVLANFF